MDKVEIGGHSYHIGRLDAMKQFHIARRLAPVIGKLGSIEKIMGSIQLVEAVEDNLDKMLKAFEPILQELGSMKEEDVNYILNSCLDVVKMEQAGTWVRVRSNGGLQFDFIDMPTMVQLAWHVIQENLLSFTNALPDLRSVTGQGQM